MKYIALGILQEDLEEMPQIGIATFQGWKLLYYIPQNMTISVQEQAQIHFQEIHKIFEKYNMLPFGFGSFLGSKEEMITILKNNQEQILEEWKRVSDTAEIRLVFEEGAILRALPEKLVSKKAGISFWQKKYQQSSQIQYFLSILNEKDNTQIIIDLKNKAKDNKLIFDFLIQKKQVENLYQLLAETLQELNIFQHEVSKPTAAFNFVKLTLKTEKY